MEYAIHLRQSVVECTYFGNPSKHNAMKTLFTILLILPLTAMLSQENCSSLEFQFQSQVDQFLIENPNCTAVDNLSILLGIGPDGISDLRPLSNLTEVTGLLEINNYGGADQYEIDTSPLSNITTAHDVMLFNVGDDSGFIGMTDISGSLVIEYSFNMDSISHDLNGFDKRTLGQAWHHQCDASVD